MVPGVQSRLFGVYLKRLQGAVAGLHEQTIVGIDDSIAQWKSTWTQAYDELFDVSQKTNLLEYGILLGRLAETYSSHPVAEEILDRLAESAIRREAWIPDPSSILITAGEFNRRRGNLNSSEARFNEALTILEHDLATREERKQTHWSLGRLFYEFSYLHRLRGDACAARAALERSEIECSTAKDEVGVEIARTLLAVLSYEEGFADLAVQELSGCLSRLENLVDNPAVRSANRSGFARRWVINARLHLSLAHVALGRYKAAWQLLRLSRADPSIAGYATAKRIEAQLFLAEGQLKPALEAIGASWDAIEQPPGDLMSTELAAATVAISGVIHGLEESEEGRRSAISCFQQACALPSDLHNRRAQAWAWAGCAILARKAGDKIACLTAIHKGLAAVQRSGAPVRAFLLKLLRSCYSEEEGPTLNDLIELVCRSG